MLVRILIFIFFISNCALAETSETDKNALEFVNEVQKIIKSNWKPKRNNESYTLVTVFKIDKFGNVKDIEFIKGPDNKEIRQAALDAIKLSEPFKSPAYLRSEGSIEIEFTFDYSVKKVTTKQPAREQNLMQADSVMYSGRKPSSRIVKIFQCLLGFILFLILVWYRIVRFLRKRERDTSFKDTRKPLYEPKEQSYDPTNVRR